jgi:hypothetical protein
MTRHRFLAASAFALLFVGPAFGAQPKTYQVTGPILEVTGDMIAIQKGKDRWEIGRDASAKVTGDPKVGDKATVEYRMSATSIDVKPAGAKAAGAKKKP